MLKKSKSNTKKIVLSASMTGTLLLSSMAPVFAVDQNVSPETSQRVEESNRGLDTQNKATEDNIESLKQQLQKELEEFKKLEAKINEGVFDEKSKVSYESALVEAEELLLINDASKEKIEKAISNLKNTVKNMRFNPVNLEPLKAEIKNIEDLLANKKLYEENQVKNTEDYIKTIKEKIKIEEDERGTLDPSYVVEAFDRLANSYKLLQDSKKRKNKSTHNNIPNGVNQAGKEANQLLSGYEWEEKQKKEGKLRADAFKIKYEDIFTLTLDTVKAENMDIISAALKELADDTYMAMSLEEEEKFIVNLYVKLFKEKYQDLYKHAELFQYLAVFEDKNYDIKLVDYDRLEKADQEYHDVFPRIWDYYYPQTTPLIEYKKSAILPISELMYFIRGIKEKEERIRNDANDTKKAFKEILKDNPKDKIIFENAIYIRSYRGDGEVEFHKYTIQSLLDELKAEDLTYRKLIKEEERFLEELLYKANNLDKIFKETHKDALSAENTDADKLNKAIEEYNKLPERVKTLLKEEQKILIENNDKLSELNKQKLIKKIEIAEKEREFKEKYKDILNKKDFHLLTDEENARINEAIKGFKGFDENIKKANEKELEILLNAKKEWLANKQKEYEENQALENQEKGLDDIEVFKEMYKDILNNKELEKLIPKDNVMLENALSDIAEFDEETQDGLKEEIELINQIEAVKKYVLSKMIEATEMSNEYLKNIDKLGLPEKETKEFKDLAKLGEQIAILKASPLSSWGALNDKYFDALNSNYLKAETWKNKTAFEKLKESGKLEQVQKDLEGLVLGLKDLTKPAEDLKTQKGEALTESEKPEYDINDEDTLKKGLPTQKGEALTEPEKPEYDINDEDTLKKGLPTQKGEALTEDKKPEYNIKGRKTLKNKLPQTGERSNAVQYTFAMILSAMAFGVTLFRRKKEK